MKKDVPSYDELASIAKKIFGITSIFPYQLLVIYNILDVEALFFNIQEYKICDEKRSEEECCSEKECCIEEYIEEYKTKRQQIVLFPTGAGKSLCFQLPSLFLTSPTLVIYPLLSLMQDQYNKLKDILNVVIFIGGQTREERESEYQKLSSSHIIIANPEVLENKEVLSKIKMRGISHLAIDEAHCVSEWGESFRPSYLNISSIIKELSPHIVTAFTATLSKPILENINRLIFLGKAHIVQSMLDRPNIAFSIRKCIIKEPILLHEIERRAKPMIIFCSSRKKAQHLARLIIFTFPDIKTRFYHAGLERDEKKEIEKEFHASKNAILVATCAYGMGVDKKDVRTVIHFEAPSTIEAYIQEAGRGGRDGNMCEALLLWSEEDKKRLLSMKTSYEKRSGVVIDYGEGAECRRGFLLQALSLSDEKNIELPICDTCDVCKGENELSKHNEVDVIRAYLGHRKIKRSVLIEKIRFLNKYWNLQYSKKLVSYLEAEGVLEEDKFFWRDMLKCAKHQKKKS